MSQPQDLHYSHGAGQCQAMWFTLFPWSWSLDLCFLPMPVLGLLLPSAWGAVRSCWQGPQSPPGSRLQVCHFQHHLLVFHSKMKGFRNENVKICWMSKARGVPCTSPKFSGASLYRTNVFAAAKPQTWRQVLTSVPGGVVFSISQAVCILCWTELFKVNVLEKPFKNGSSFINIIMTEHFQLSVSEIWDAGAEISN